MLVDIEQPKLRLTSKAQIAQAVYQLTRHSVPVEDWLGILTREFYLDLDQFNEVLGASTYAQAQLQREAS